MARRAPCDGAVGEDLGRVAENYRHYQAIHGRLSTKAIVETLMGDRQDKQQARAELFGVPRHPTADQTLRTYEYPDTEPGSLLKASREAR